MESNIHRTFTKKATLQKLQEEFETVGIKIGLNNDVDLSDLVDCSLILINLYRKVLSTVSELEFQNNFAKKEKVSLLNKIAILKYEIKERENKVKKLHTEMLKSTLKNEELKRELDILKSKSCLMLKAAKRSEELQEKRLRRILSENENLIDKAEKNFGKYVSRDDVLIKVIEKYKCNEEIYKETIKRLHDNNNRLIHDVLHLKEEIRNYFSLDNKEQS